MISESFGATWADLERMCVKLISFACKCQWTISAHRRHAQVPLIAFTVFLKVECHLRCNKFHSHLTASNNSSTLSKSIVPSVRREDIHLDDVTPAPPSVRPVDGDVDVPLAPHAEPGVQRAVEGDPLAHRQQVLESFPLIGYYLNLDHLIKRLHTFPSSVWWSDWKRVCRFSSLKSFTLTRFSRGRFCLQFVIISAQRSTKHSLSSARKLFRRQIPAVTVQYVVIPWRGRGRVDGDLLLREVAPALRPLLVQRLVPGHPLVSPD